MLTQTIEKCYEQNIELHILIIDFEQAFDSTDRQQLIREMKIPAKLIELTRMTMQDLTERITAKDGDTENIRIKVGVSQGDCLQHSLILR